MFRIILSALYCLSDAKRPSTSLLSSICKCTVISIVAWIFLSLFLFFSYFLEKRTDRCNYPAVMGTAISLRFLEFPKFSNWFFSAFFILSYSSSPWDLVIYFRPFMSSFFKSDSNTFMFQLTIKDCIDLR